MRYKLNISQFCSLSQEIKFQSWLSGVAYDLYEIISENFKNQSSCKTNTTMMINIQNELRKRGLDNQLVGFLKQDYPLVLIEVTENEIPKTNSPTKILTSISYPDPVFSYYNPSLLIFPQKIILENTNQTQLTKDVNTFVKDKLGVDYVLIGNRTYIEYFKYKYRLEMENIIQKSRDIYKYKIKHGIII